MFRRFSNHHGRGIHGRHNCKCRAEIKRMGLFFHAPQRNGADLCSFLYAVVPAYHSGNGALHTVRKIPFYSEIVKNSPLQGWGRKKTFYRACLKYA